MNIASPMNPGRSNPDKPLTIIGLGNEFLSDDGVGIRVVRELQNRMAAGAAVFEELAVGGLQLMDYVVGFRECIIVDAITSGRHPAGTLFRFVQVPDKEPVSLTSSHQVDLGQVLALTKLMGAELPEKLTVYGVEVSDITTFHEGCTEEVSDAIPLLVDCIYDDLHRGVRNTNVRTGEWQILDHPVTI
jgi:hydrogenase maturation protease